MVLKIIFLFGFVTLILVSIDQGRAVVNANHRLLIIEEDILLGLNIISFIAATLFLIGMSTQNNLLVLLVQFLTAISTGAYYSLLKNIDNFQLPIACMNTAWIVLLIPVILL